MEERISDEVMDTFKQQILGKKIRVKTKDVEGICEYFGYNPNFPSWKIQVTIGRMPITHLKISDIELLE